jgi:hypothetical protein
VAVRPRSVARRPPRHRRVSASPSRLPRARTSRRCATVTIKRPGHAPDHSARSRGGGVATTKGAAEP